MKIIVMVSVATALAGICMVSCSSSKKKKGEPTSLFGYPYKSRHNQVKDAFGG